MRDMLGCFILSFMHIILTAGETTCTSKNGFAEYYAILSKQNLTNYNSILKSNNNALEIWIQSVREHFKLLNQLNFRLDNATIADNLEEHIKLLKAFKICDNFTMIMENIKIYTENVAVEET